MSDTSGEHSSSDEAADGCSLASPDGDSVNEADGYKPTKLQAIRKTSVDPKQGPVEQACRHITVVNDLRFNASFSRENLVLQNFT